MFSDGPDKTEEADAATPYAGDPAESRGTDDQETNRDTTESD